MIKSGWSHYDHPLWPLWSSPSLFFGARNHIWMKGWGKSWGLLLRYTLWQWFGYHKVATPWSFIIFYSYSHHNSQTEHHAVLKKTAEEINQVRSRVIFSQVYIQLNFAAIGVAPCWPLESMQVYWLHFSDPEAQSTNYTATHSHTHTNTATQPQETYLIFCGRICLTTVQFVQFVCVFVCMYISVYVSVRQQR